MSNTYSMIFVETFPTDIYSFKMTTVIPYYSNYDNKEPWTLTKSYF